jgi:hypothetical protein
LFISAGEPGNIKKVQASVTAARKVFRVMRVSTAIVSLLEYVSGFVVGAWY